MEVSLTQVVTAGTPIVINCTEAGSMLELSVGVTNVKFHVYDYVTRRVLMSKTMTISSIADLLTGDVTGTYASQVSVTFTQPELDSLVATVETTPNTPENVIELSEMLYYDVWVNYTNTYPKQLTGGLFTKA